MKNSDKLFKMSEEELSVLHKLLSIDVRRVVVSRAYYASFYAVQGLLDSIGKEAEKMKHREILRTFKETFNAKYPDLIKTYLFLSSARRKADREGVSMNKEEILKIIDEAGNFVEKIKKISSTES